MRTVWPKSDGIVVRGRRFLQSDLVRIRHLIRTHPNWGRTKLSEEVCRAIDWRQPNGRLKDRGCRVALLKLEAFGFLQLPLKKLDRGGRPPRQDLTFHRLGQEISEMPQDLNLVRVETSQQSRIWNSLIAQHHYLGLATPVGRLIRYLIVGSETILGAISFTEAAWSIIERDVALEEYGIERGKIHEVVVSNNRFLILPNVQIKNLASKTLGMARKQVALDWHRNFGTKPAFIETFVDPTRFEGVCYRAANWILMGKTKGFAKRGGSHESNRVPKLLFLVGTEYNSQKFLRTWNARGKRRAA